MLAVPLSLVGLILLLSYAIEIELRFSFFYLLPIAFAAWFLGRSAGIAFAFLSAAVWLAEFLFEHAPGVKGREVACWNALLLLGFFLVLALLLSALEQALAREKAAARVDALTGLANRRAFFELADGEIRRASRYGGRLTLIYLDLDKFKRVNDRDGHQTGDRVLVLAAEALRVSLRVNDIVARLGGDEFVVLLPQTTVQDAEAVYRKLEAQLSQRMRAGAWPITVSAGAAAFDKPPESVDEMVRLADELMYSVKTSGGNGLATCVVGRA